MIGFITDLEKDLRLLHSMILQRLQSYFKNESFLGIQTEPFSFSYFTGHNLQGDENLIVLIALVPHLDPNFFETIIQEVLPQGGDFPQFGGVKGSNHRGLLPTGETVQFILAGNDFERRILLQKMLLGNSSLLKKKIIELEPVKEGEPVMSGRLLLTGDWLYELLTGEERATKFNAEFPAKLITTQMSWDDLVLPSYTREQIDDIVIWLQHHPKLEEDVVLQKKVKPGYKVLFYGPSGTGKTLTAALLGQHFNKEVYRVDLSQVVSKYIGETEKNLEKIFTKAEDKDWILFFDEADALFGKRTQMQSSHDRYANQEVSYLLQRMEDYPRLLVLASNFKSNLDDAFLRRFHSIIHFPNPKGADRLQLWQKTWPANYKAEDSINIKELAEKYELNGAAIVNIIHYAALKSASRNDACILYQDIVDAIRREYHKDEKSLS